MNRLLRYTGKGRELKGRKTKKKSLPDVLIQDTRKLSIRARGLFYKKNLTGWRRGLGNDAN